jgi:hypothetical protein
MKKEFTKLFNFFKTLSGNAKYIDIASFNKAFEGREYMERITASLFTYLDKGNKGKVSFEDFLLKFFGNISRDQAKAITSWVEKQELHTENFGKMVKDGLPVKVKPRVREKELKKLKKTFNEYVVPGVDCKACLMQILTERDSIRWQSKFLVMMLMMRFLASTMKIRMGRLSFMTLSG